MDRQPPYEKSHLVVAAVRVLSHRGGRPPAEEEVAELLDLSPDLVRSLIRALGARGVLQVVQSPFETRVELRDHTLLEELPREEGESVLEADLEEFRERHRRRQEEAEKLFAAGEAKRRKEERVSHLDDEFRRFRHRRSTSPDPEEE